MRELREERDAVMASVRQRDTALQVGSAIFAWPIRGLEVEGTDRWQCASFRYPEGSTEFLLSLCPYSGACTQAAALLPWHLQKYVLAARIA